MTQSKQVKHPSYGYCSEEDFRRVNELGIGPERDQLMKKIKAANAKPKKKKV